MAFSGGGNPEGIALNARYEGRRNVVIRMQCSFGADTAFPRDRMTITPHFKTSGASPSVGTLTNDLATALDTWLAGLREVVVKAYDAEHVKPNPPQAVATKHAGLTPASPGPRETSLCLSYYAGSNVPRRRGRLYIPAIFIAGGALPVRPTTTHQSSLSQFADMFKNLGGVDVDWCVWSRRDSAAHSVTNWFVDDDWDTQRRRGLRPTSRTVGTTSEAGFP
jgi:hypothetical protein